MVLSVFIDLKKAFDTVSHFLILCKLESIGITGDTLNWFCSNLSNRKQFTVLENDKSKCTSVDVGIPQGLLLGVLLFQLLINSLYECLRFCSCKSYADDTTIFVVGWSLRFLNLKMQSDLQNLAVWLKLNSLKLNTKKTKCMLFNKEGLFPNLCITIEVEELEMVIEFKFLGIYLDCLLSFELHFRELYTKLNKSTVVICKLAQILPGSCLQKLYFAYYHSHLSYGQLIWWSLLSKQQQNKLQVGNG